MRKALVLNPKDNVAIALTNLKRDDVVEVQVGGDVVKVKVLNEIPFGHKFAIRDIGNDEPIIKYGEVVGVATKSIGVGEHVHVHNVRGTRGRPKDK
ncbi:MAG: UxaA family hydrolase [Sulfolobales archaeon]|nr:UxaA family hydrolase [Sulfolobales archaeon]MCX8186166.1 UxaA family hydrolase [Sulfolobales archaeon]MDW7969461.1 UxaA family hydrolase [Sulfolobales archaeon]